MTCTNILPDPKPFVHHWRELLRRYHIVNDLQALPVVRSKEERLSLDIFVDGHIASRGYGHFVQLPRTLVHVHEFDGNRRVDRVGRPVKFGVECN